MDFANKCKSTIVLLLCAAASLHKVNGMLSTFLQMPEHEQFFYSTAIVTTPLFFAFCDYTKHCRNVLQFPEGNFENDGSINFTARLHIFYQNKIKTVFNIAMLIGTCYLLVQFSRQLIQNQNQNKNELKMYVALTFFSGTLQILNFSSAIKGCSNNNDDTNHLKAIYKGLNSMLELTHSYQELLKLTAYLTKKMSLKKEKNKKIKKEIDEYKKEIDQLKQNHADLIKKTATRILL